MKNLLLLPAFALLALLPVAAADKPAAKPDADQPEASAPPEEPPSSPEAGAAWKKLSDEFQAMPKVDEKNPSPEAKKSITALYGESHDFFTKFPDDPHVISATMLWAQLGSAMIRFKLDGAPTLKDIDNTLNLLTTNPKIAPQKRAEIRVVMIAKAIREAIETPEDEAQWDAIDAKVDAFEKDYGMDFRLGDQAVVPMLRQQQVEIYSQMPDTKRYDALLQRLATSKNDKLADMAKQMIANQKTQAALMTKPLDFKFKSVDGKQVDLAKLRGKVVLIDFWATWCPPCRAQMPDIIDAYKKYHDKGLEIVGVSLDQDKDALTGFIKENEMPWPQYFDGKGWQSDVTKHFGIDALPALWLVNKKGMVVSTHVRLDLDEEIGKQIAAP